MINKVDWKYIINDDYDLLKYITEKNSDTNNLLPLHDFKYDDNLKLILSDYRKDIIEKVINNINDLENISKWTNNEVNIEKAFSNYLLQELLSEKEIEKNLVDFKILYQYNIVLWKHYLLYKII